MVDENVEERLAQQALRTTASYQALLADVIVKKPVPLGKVLQNGAMVGICYF